MEDLQSLSRLAPGERATVCRLMSHGAMRRRMLDIGLTEGAQVECLGSSPMGDPRAYLIRGAVIALRSTDAADVLVTRLL